MEPQGYTIFESEENMAVVKVLVVEFQHRPTVDEMEKAMDFALKDHKISPKDIISINPVLSISRREIWYYKREESK